MCNCDFAFRHPLSEPSWRTDIVRRRNMQLGAEEERCEH